jgi:hypothetical protein
MGDRAWLTDRGSGGCRVDGDIVDRVARWPQPGSTSANRVLRSPTGQPAALCRDVAPPVSGCHGLDAVITASDTVAGPGRGLRHRAGGPRDPHPQGPGRPLAALRRQLSGRRGGDRGAPVLGKAGDARPVTMVLLPGSPARTRSCGRNTVCWVGEENRGTLRRIGFEPPPQSTPRLRRLTAGPPAAQWWWSATTSTPGWTSRQFSRTIWSAPVRSSTTAEKRRALRSADRRSLANTSRRP